MKLFFLIMTTALSLTLPLIGKALTPGKEINFPLEIKTRQAIQDMTPGFISMTSDSPHYLARVTFYSGKPFEKASLAPDSSSKSKMHWSFSKGEKIYISCGYNQTNIELFKALPSGISECTVHYDMTAMSPLGGIPIKIECH